MRCMVLRFGFSETSIFVALCCVIHALCLIAPGGLGQVTYLSTLRLSTLRLTRHGLLWHVRVISASSTCLPSCVEYVTFWALQTILPLYINFFFSLHSTILGELWFVVRSIFSTRWALFLLERFSLLARLIYEGGVRLKHDPQGGRVVWKAFPCCIPPLNFLFQFICITPQTNLLRLLPGLHGRSLSNSVTFPRRTVGLG